MTDITVSVAAEFAEALSRFGVTAQMLQEITTSSEKAASLALLIATGDTPRIALTAPFVPLVALDGARLPINVLRRYGLEYVEEMATVSRSDLLHMRNMGVRRVDLIEHAVLRRGVRLLPEGASRKAAIKELYGSYADAPPRLKALKPYM